LRSVAGASRGYFGGMMRVKSGISERRLTVAGSSQLSSHSHGQFLELQFIRKLVLIINYVFVFRASSVCEYTDG
jgi:hypothetical protein